MTGSVGFRRMGGMVRADLTTLCKWSTTHEFAHIDLTGVTTPADVAMLRTNGLDVGSADLLGWTRLLSADAEARRTAAAENVSHVRTLAAVGVTTFFAVAAPEDPALPRAANFGYAVESYRAICRAAADAGARVALEGAPGRPPHFATIGCTPADLRALFAAVDSPALGVNFDPSHAVRMGIDPVRMLREFAPRVFHVHAKDALVLNDGLYDHGHLQQATFANPQKFGAFAWRYTLPGKGDVPWRELFAALRDSGYAGRVSIELEDGDVDGEQAERAALLEARDFLAKVAAIQIRT